MEAIPEHDPDAAVVPGRQRRIDLQRGVRVHIERVGAPQDPDDRIDVQGVAVELGLIAENETSIAQSRGIGTRLVPQESLPAADIHVDLKLGAAWQQSRSHCTLHYDEVYSLSAKRLPRIPWAGDARPACSCHSCRTAFRRPRRWATLPSAIEVLGFLKRWLCGRFRRSHEAHRRFAFAPKRKGCARSNILVMVCAQAPPASIVATRSSRVKHFEAAPAVRCWRETRPVRPMGSGPNRPHTTSK